LWFIEVKIVYSVTYGEDNMHNNLLTENFWLKFFSIDFMFFKFLLFQSGKVSFSYIYGIGVMGCLAFYCLLSLMATKGTVTLGAVISVLGYCLLPMVVLSGVNVLITIQ